MRRAPRVPHSRSTRHSPYPSHPAPLQSEYVSKTKAKNDYGLSEGAVKNLKGARTQVTSSAPFGLGAYAAMFFDGEVDWETTVYPLPEVKAAARRK